MSTSANNDRILVNTLEELKNVLQQHEVDTSTKYIYHHGGKAFTTQEKFSPMPSMQLNWDGDVPYFNIAGAFRIYTCHQGKDNNVHKKKKYAQNRDNKLWMHNIITKRYDMKHPTKKVDCPARIYVTRIFYLPHYKIPKMTKTEKVKCSQVIKSLISIGEDLLGEEKYMFRLPDVSQHQNHNVGAATEQLDPILQDKIKELLKNGKRSIAIITEQLQEFVNKELDETNELRQRFHPPSRDLVRSAMVSAKKELRWSSIDLDKTYKMLETWDNANLFFRPCHVADGELTEDTTLVPGDDDDDDSGYLKLGKNARIEDYLLFVYQTNDMKRLYRRYGKNSVLLDATHRTCKYALPLYFLVVKTNVDYQIVAVLITQLETKDALVEGLTIVRDWNPDVTPKYGMVDFAAEEIMALEAVYDNIQVFICSVTRERIWTKWSSRKRHCLPKDEVLSRLRRVANASSEEKLQAAIEEVKSFELFETTPLKGYFEKTWMPKLKRWALAYKPPDLLFDTNNGVESMNEELKYPYPQGLKNCPLSKKIEVVGSKFLPEIYKSYVENNVHMITKHRKYGDDIPEFLHNRPKWFIDHVMQKISAAEESTSRSVSRSSTDENAFYVSSVSDNDVVYMVNFDQEKQVYSCTCEGFRRTRLLCKHFIIVGVEFPEWQLGRISAWMFDNPIFTYDEDIDGEDEWENGRTADELEKLEMADIKRGNSLHFEELQNLHVIGNKKEIIMKCNSTIRSLQSLMWSLPEPDLVLLKRKLDTLFKVVSSQVK